MWRRGLQQAAAPGEVLIAAATLELVGGTVDVESVEPLVLKGKSEPVPAFRLLAARAADERRHDTVFVGRERELGLLGEAWGRALAEQRCELVTVVGDAGIGKSRLAAEALASIEARVVRGRCLPYGAGITYWPVVEVVKQLDALPSDPAAAAAIRSLLGGVGGGDVGGGDRLGFPQAARGAGAAGRGVRRHPVGRGDVPRPRRARGAALHRRADSAALHGPPGASRGAPDLAGHGAARAADERDAASFIGAAVPEELRARIAAAAAGNPLFVSEMLAMADEARERRGRGASNAKSVARGASRSARCADRRVLGQARRGDRTRRRSHHPRRVPGRGGRRGPEAGAGGSFRSGRGGLSDASTSRSRGCSGFGCVLVCCGAGLCELRPREQRRRQVLRGVCCPARRAARASAARW